MNNWKLLVVSHLAAGLFGYSVAPREVLETEVKHVGVFSTDTRRVLAVTVESLRAENKLIVWTYKGAAAVSVERTKWWVLTGRHKMLIPASVNYLVDLSKLEADDVAYDQQANIITIALPPLMIGEVALQPEAADSTVGGLLTFDEGEVDELARANYLAARRAFIKQAQGATLVAAARKEAERAVARTFQIALGAAGLTGTKVVVTFD